MNGDTLDTQRMSLPGHRPMFGHKHVIVNLVGWIFPANLAWCVLWHLSSCEYVRSYWLGRKRWRVYPLEEVWLSSDLVHSSYCLMPPLMPKHSNQCWRRALAVVKSLLAWWQEEGEGLSLEWWSSWRRQGRDIKPLEVLVAVHLDEEVDACWSWVRILICLPSHITEDGVTYKTRKFWTIGPVTWARCMSVVVFGGWSP